MLDIITTCTSTNYDKKTLKMCRQSLPLRGLTLENTYYYELWKTWTLVVS